jgi:CBS domain-containing protein
MLNKTASQVMTRNVVATRPDALLTEAIKTLLDHNISGLPVVDAEGRLTGIITEHDIMNFTFSGDAADTMVEKAMTPDVITFGPDAELGELVNCFAAKRIRRVPIVDDGKLVGIVSRRDILRVMLEMYNSY